MTHHTSTEVTRIIELAKACSRAGEALVFAQGEMNPDVDVLPPGFAREVECNDEETYIYFQAPGQEDCKFSQGQVIAVLIAAESGRAAVHTNGDDCWGDFTVTSDGITITLDEIDEDGDAIIINL